MEANMDSILPPKPKRNTVILRDYLAEHDDTFRELQAIRAEGWSNPKGDTHFQQQRRHADTANEETKRKFYFMMQKIGAELNDATGAMVINKMNPSILDLCMAPGGFSAAALKVNRSAKLSGISLPREKGGHEMLLPLCTPGRLPVEVHFLDITLLAAEIGVGEDEIPSDHPDAAEFLHKRVFSSTQKFDLVFCDGQVLRTHQAHRAPYRERNEAKRLSTSQFIIALQHMRQGGTLVALLHKPDAWMTCQLLYTLSKFSNVQIYKPKTSHRTRSSFYVVAKDVQPDTPEAQHAVAVWRQVWRQATIGFASAAPEGAAETEEGRTEDGANEDMEDAVVSDEAVEDVVAKFGPRLIEMSRPVWRTQADALKNAFWNK